MNRKEITKLLGDLLVRDKLLGKYWASEVTFNYGRKNEFRVDYMKFDPINQTTSGIEGGCFSAYEVKSCLADYRSSNGHNLHFDKNYYVMPMELYKKIIQELPWRVGVYCPVPFSRDKLDEFDDPTPMDSIDLDCAGLVCIRSSHQMLDREISVSSGLFCMLRSGY